MSTVNVIDSAATTAVEDDPFREIVLGDPLLLRAEFDDLIDAAWEPVKPGDAGVRRRPGDGRNRPLRPRHPGDDAHVNLAVVLRDRRIRARKRSPPPER